MKHAYGFLLLFVTALLGLLQPVRAQTPLFSQAVSVNPDGLNGSAVGRDVVVDAAGNQYVVGIFNRQVRLGGVSLSATNTNPNMYLAKRNSAGTWQWVVQVQTSIYGSASAQALALDASGNVLVTGSYYGTVTLNTSAPGVSPATTTSLPQPASGNNGFLARFNGATGACGWAVSWACTGGNTSGYGVAVDATGSAYVTGFYTGSATFTSSAPGAAVTTSTLTPNVANDYSNDIFVARFASTGACNLTAKAGGYNDEVSYDIALDASSNVYITGRHKGNTSFVRGGGNAPTVLNLAANDGENIFVAKLTPATGFWAWAVQAGSVGYNLEEGRSLVVNGTNVFVAGSFNGTAAAPASFGGRGLITSSAGYTDVFLANFSTADGSCSWAVKAGGITSDYGYGVTSIGTGTGATVYLTGSFEGAATFTTSGPSNPAVTTTTLSGIGGSSGNVFVAKFASTGACTWAAEAGSAEGLDVGYGVAADASGNVYSTGIVNGVAQFVTPGDAVSASNSAFLGKLTAAGVWQAPAATEIGTGGYSYGDAVASSAGKQYVAGRFRGHLQFGTTRLISKGTGENMFLAKRDAAGNWLWAVQAEMGTNNHMNKQCQIGTDAAGNVYLTAIFDGTAVLTTSAPGAAPATSQTLTASGTGDVLLARFDGATGACAWATRAGGSGFNYVFGLAVDEAGTTFITGSIAGSMAFPTSAPGAPSPTTFTLSSAGSRDIFVARFSNAGVCAWAVQAGTSNQFEHGRGIALDTLGNLYVTGEFAGTASFPTSGFGVSPATSLLLTSVAGSTDSYVARFDQATGACAWAVQGGGNSGDAGSGVAVQGGKVYVAGYYQNVAAFTSSAPGVTPVTTITLPSGTGQTLYVARLNAATGACEWVVPGGGVLGQNCEVSADEDHNVFVSAGFTGTTTFRTSAYGVSPVATTSLTAPGSGTVEAFLARYTGATGACTWAVRAGGATNDYPRNVAVDNQGSAYMVGDYEGSATFGSFTRPGTEANPTAFFAALQTTPTLTALSTPSELPGLSLTLTGTDFTRASTVRFGSLSAPDVTRLSATSISVKVPVGATAGPISVTTAAGTTTGLAFAPLNVYNSGTPNDCATVVAPTPSINDDAWHYLLTSGGQVVLGYKYSGPSLGDFSVDVLRTGSTGTVRQDDAGKYYLDRNWHLNATMVNGNGVREVVRFDGRTVMLRVFGAPSELTRLQYAATRTGLSLTQYSGTNEDCALGNNATTGEVRLLPATLIAADPDAAGWFGLETTVADHFSEFYVTEGSVVLPVELTAFTAARRQQAVRLAWTTASEKNSAAFEVERSLDGQQFRRLGSVAAAGHSSTTRQYGYLDEQLPVGASQLYYRLRQVDQDGTATYSAVRTVAASGQSAAGLALYPNPARTATLLTGADAGATVQVLDALGRPVAKATADAAGNARLVLPAGLRAGVYLVRSGARAVRLVVE
ncbi:T9SS type A sorting domain-containing protein [Hymenobacter edaphi]|nr:T9SS type A sorting domain-containing protein [Hymenobacter edaphi]